MAKRFPMIVDKENFSTKTKLLRNNQDSYDDQEAVSLSQSLSLSYFENFSWKLFNKKLLYGPWSAFKNYKIVI